MSQRRLWAIDPGSDRLGLASAQLDLAIGAMSVERTLELDASRVLAIDRAYADIADYHGERFARQRAITDLFERELALDPPDNLISEAPFIHIRSHAYAALVETLQSLRISLYKHRPWVVFESVAPAAAKAAIGAARPDRSGEKGFIFSQLEKTLEGDETVSLAEGVELSQIGEHCVDAVVVAYYYHTRYVRLNQEI